MKLNLWILVGVLGTVAGLEAVETPVIRGGDKTVAVSMEIANAEEVKLTVTVGPDDYDWDQAVWGNPVFVMKDGTRLDATTFEPCRAVVGYAQLGKNRNPLNSKYVPYPYVADDGRNARTGDEKRVVRGGSWYSRPKLATASFRRAYRPYAPVYDVGFRVVVEE